ncbi:MAG TPA: efflux RND transporter permease subunit, partial [Chromatiaceae bacterium]|nr:efflux RND transporter permease subunit [Chromatiaceae bacterium]
LVKKLPPGVGLEWTGISYEERAAGAQAPLLYTLSILVVFLTLAALYESWSVPFAVILGVPIGVLGAVLAALGRGLPSDIYFQVGLLATIGLAAKNAILIVEFARTLQEEGRSAMSAALEAARLRIRPIVMTSLAFGFGVLPLAISTGAGSGGQNSVGTGVLGGVAASTLLGVFFVPLFFVLIRGRWRRGLTSPASRAAGQRGEAGPGASPVTAGTERSPALSGTSNPGPGPASGPAPGNSAAPAHG